MPHSDGVGAARVSTRRGRVRCVHPAGERLSGGNSQSLPIMALAAVPTACAYATVHPVPGEDASTGDVGIDLHPESPVIDVTCIVS